MGSASEILMVGVLYPERTKVSAKMVIGWAWDDMKTQKIKELGLIEDVEIELAMNSVKCPNLEEAKSYLQDNGLVEFERV